MALINGGIGGGSGGDVSGDYKFTQNESGELVLTYKSQPVSTYSPDGSWFKTSVSTGVGSLHLGGNESGGVAHSISSTGQNVGFKNEFSVSGSNKWFFFPCWQAVSTDGSARQNATYRQYGALDTASLPNGTAALNAVDYDFPLAVTANSEVYRLTVIPAEAYDGKLRNSILSNTTGAEIYDTTATVSAVIDQPLVIDYQYPFSVRSGDNLQLRLVKADGSFLKVRAGQINNTIPYRSLRSAPFSDIEIQNRITGAATSVVSSNLTANRLVASDASGKIISANLVANRPVTTTSTGEPAASLTTNDELANVRGGVTRNTTVVIEDADGFVFNDNGTMMQASAGRVWAYVQGKVTGAVSNTLTSNLTASRAMATDSGGKVAVANPSLSELNNIAGGVTRNTTVTLEDGDGVVVNDNGSMIQAAMSRVWTYIQSKITGAISGLLTTNLTANRMLRSDASGKITTMPLTANQVAFIDSNGLLAGRSLVANRIMMTDETGLPSTVSAVGPFYYKNSIGSAGTFNVASAFNGGFTVNFIRTASTIYLQVTHTSLGSRYQYQTTVNNGSPSSFWTSSSGNNYPANLPAIATNGASISGWFYGTDGSGQSTSVRVDFSIITNGMGNAVCYACVS